MRSLSGKVYTRVGNPGPTVKVPTLINSEVPPKSPPPTVPHSLPQSPLQFLTNITVSRATTTMIIDELSGHVYLSCSAWSWRQRFCSRFRSAECSIALAIFSFSWPDDVTMSSNRIQQI